MGRTSPHRRRRNAEQSRKERQREKGRAKKGAEKPSPTNDWVSKYEQQNTHTSGPSNVLGRRGNEVVQMWFFVRGSPHKKEGKIQHTASLIKLFHVFIISLSSAFINNLKKLKQRRGALFAGLGCCKFERTNLLPFLLLIYCNGSDLPWILCFNFVPRGEFKVFLNFARPLSYYVWPRELLSG